MLGNQLSANTLHLFSLGTQTNKHIHKISKEKTVKWSVFFRWKFFETNRIPLKAFLYSRFYWMMRISLHHSLFRGIPMPLNEIRGRSVCKWTGTASVSLGGFRMLWNDTLSFFFENGATPFDEQFLPVFFYFNFLFRESALCHFFCI